MTIASLLYDCDHFGSAQTIKSPDDLTKNHRYLIVHGGADISPSIYKEDVWTAYAQSKPSQRDLVEMATLERAWELGIPVLAICRGAQLVCAMTGGTLYQDVPNHESTRHKIHLPNNQSIITNSFHHQMMIPKDATILGHAGMNTALRSKNGIYVEETILEPEIVYWKDQRTLGVQGHPEWDHSRGGIYEYTVKLMNDLFGV
jgi:putative glutamine amidotransferase